MSYIVFAPAIVALILAFFPKDSDANVFRYITLGATLGVLAAVLGVFFLPSSSLFFSISEAGLQNVEQFSWINSDAFRIDYFMGIDGISFPLIVLTAGVSVLAMVASWSITKQVKGFCILFLLLETGMLGVFLALDFFLFYIFWEVMLLPMYFLIGIWGGPRKEYAAIKFFLYTLFGSVLMLIAILMLYFASDVRKLPAEQLFASHVVGHQMDLTLRAPPEGDAEVGVPLTMAEIKAKYTSDDELTAAIATLREETTKVQVDAIKNADKPQHTFNIMALAALARQGDMVMLDKNGDEMSLLFGWNLQHWAFLLLFIGFAIKVPSVPLHTWLPDAHVEAPTPISMILAGVLLKMGGYGILRICYPICPEAGFDFRWFICTVGVVSMVYGAFAALAQKDFKRMVAYSSVSHMGYVVLGLGVWSATMGNGYNADYWNMGIKGAMYQMIAHGVSSAGMFFMVGVIYDRVHHRNLEEFGGLYGKMPLYSGLAFAIFFAGLGLPGLCGFIGEVFVVLSVWNFSYVLACISAFVVILTAGYILWALQRVYLGAEYKGPHEEALTPITGRELSVAVPLVFLAILFGVAPNLLLRYMNATIDQQVNDLTAVIKQVDIDEAAIAVEAAAAEAAEFNPLKKIEIEPKLVEPVPVATPDQDDVALRVQPFNKDEVN